MSIGRSKAKIYVETDTKTTFNDVVGVDEAKEGLKEIVEPARCRRARRRFKHPAEAGAGRKPQRSYSPTNSRRWAVPAAPIPRWAATKRSRRSTSCWLNWTASIRAVGLVLIAATNRPEILDPALLRAGRFDRQVLIDRPDKRGRIQLANLYFKGHKIAADVSAEKIAALTPGLIGADMAEWSTRQRWSTRRSATESSMNDFTNAVERIVAGLEKKKRLLTPKERQVVAHHKTGHALAATSLPGADTVHQVSIIPHGVGALGYTIQRPIEDRFVITREALLDKMAVLLGGRASEWGDVPSPFDRRGRRSGESDRHNANAGRIRVEADL